VFPYERMDGQTDKTEQISRFAQTCLNAGKGLQEIKGGTVNRNMLPYICLEKVKVKFSRYRPGVAQGWVSGQQHAPAALYPRERPGTHCTGGWVAPRAGLDGRKISSPPGFDPGPSSP